MNARYYVLTLLGSVTLHSMEEPLPTITPPWECTDYNAELTLSLEGQLKNTLDRLGAYEIQPGCDRILPSLVIESAAPALQNLVRRCMKTEHTSKINPQVPPYIILDGPSGFGKSTLAQYMASLIKPKAYFVKGTAFADQYKNSGSANLRALFDPLFQMNEPTAIVIDEIGALINKKQEEKNDDMIKEFGIILDRSKMCKNILIIATVNDVHDIPDIIKTRFRGHCYSVKRPSSACMQSVIKYYVPGFDSLGWMTKRKLKQFAQKWSIRELTTLAATIKSCAFMHNREQANEQDVIEALDDFATNEKKFEKPVPQDLKDNAHIWLGGIGIVTSIVALGISVYMQEKLHNQQLVHSERIHKMQQDSQAHMQGDNQAFQTRLQGDSQTFQTNLHGDNQRLQRELQGTQIKTQLITAGVGMLFQALLVYWGGGKAQ